MFHTYKYRFNKIAEVFKEKVKEQEEMEERRR